MEKSAKFYEDVAKLQSWAKSFREFRANEWDTLPDIDLYMDQVIGYLNRQLNRNQYQRTRPKALIRCKTTGI